MEGEEPPGGSCHAAIRMEHTTLASMESASSSNDSRKLCDAAFCSLRAIKKREDVWRCGRHDNLFLQPTEKVRGRKGEEETLCFVCRSSVWWCEDTARERHRESMVDTESMRSRLEGRHVKCYTCAQIVCVACLTHRYVNAVDLCTDRAKSRCPHCLIGN